MRYQYETIVMSSTTGQVMCKGRHHSIRSAYTTSKQHVRRSRHKVFVALRSITTGRSYWIEGRGYVTSSRA